LELCIVLAGAKDYYNKDKCVAWVNVGGCIWTEGYGDQCFECTAKAVSEGQIQEIDALAIASTFPTFLTPHMFSLSATLTAWSGTMEGKNPDAFSTAQWNETSKIVFLSLHGVACVCLLLLCMQCCSAASFAIF
jgi:hypothetical protein